jgi:ketosteroid isomerase-like protein
MRRWRSALRLLNSAIGGSKLSLSLGVRDGTGFYRFLCPGFDRRRTVGRPGHVSHPATQCLPLELAILAETEQIDDSTRFTDLAAPIIDMKEPTAAQASRNRIGNSNQPQVAQHDPAKNDNTVKIRELVDRQVQAWERHDFGIAAPDWLPGGELISPRGHVPAQEMQTAMAGYFKQFRDLRVTVKNVFISNDGTKAGIEWDWDVTRRRDGARAVTHDAIIVDLVGGRIASWREYFDFGNSIDAKP